MFKAFLEKLFFDFLFLFQKRTGLALGTQVFLIVMSMPSHAFLSEILEAKKKIESSLIQLESLTNTLEEIEGFAKIENEYLAYEKDLKEFQETLDEYEKLGLDVKDFMELRAYDPSSLRGQIDFFKNYLRRANKLLKTLSSLMKSPEAITASEQMETNRTLRALLEDSQITELRKLREKLQEIKSFLREEKKNKNLSTSNMPILTAIPRKRVLVCFIPSKTKMK